MERESELKPCPFCGGKAVLMHGGPGNSFVGCAGCKATSDDCSEERAIAKWNRRPAPRPSVSPDIEGLVERLTRERDEERATHRRTVEAMEFEHRDIEAQRDLLSGEVERLRGLLWELYEFIDSERLRDPEYAHHNDRDEFRSRNEQHPVLLAKITAAIATINPSSQGSGG